MSAQTKKQQELAATLNQFYQKPIAKVSLELFLSIGLILFLSIFAIKPTLVTMSDLIKEIEDKQELNEDLTNKVAALNSAQAIYNANSERLYVLDQAVPSQPEVIRNLKILEKLATESKVVITGVSMQEVPPTEIRELNFTQKTKQSLPISITVSGNYTAIKEFTDRIINNRRAFLIDTVVFSIDDSSAAKALSASVSLNVPYFGALQ